MDKSEALKILNDPRYSSDSQKLEAILTMAAYRDVTPALLWALDHRLTVGAMYTHGGWQEDRQGEFWAIHYPEIRATFAGLAETELPALKFLTEQTIKGNRGPWVEFEGYVEVFERINPKKALPQTKEMLEKLLGYHEGNIHHYADRFRYLYKQLPNVGFFGKLFN